MARYILFHAILGPLLEEILLTIRSIFFIYFNQLARTATNNEI